MQNINVNIVPDNFPQTIRYSQGDIDRQFKINVTDFEIPVGATVKIQATKPSGFGFSVAGTVSDNSVTFTTTEEMTDEAGRFQAELQITAGGDVIGTANFLMVGERNPHPEGTTDGSQGTIIPELTLLVERVEKAASDILDMEVVATTLPAGSQATYSYDEDLNKATFGIPEGQAGAGAAGVVASAYSAAKTYKVGDYVLYNSNLYRCTTAITTAEAWTAAHWTQVVLADDVTDLKTDFNNQIDLINDNLGYYEELDIEGYDSRNSTSAGANYSPFMFPSSSYSYLGKTICKVKVDMASTGILSIGYIADSDIVSPFDRSKCIVKEAIKVTTTGEQTIYLGNPFVVPEGYTLFMGMNTDTAFFKYGNYGTQKGFKYINGSSMNVSTDVNHSLGVDVYSRSYEHDLDVVEAKADKGAEVYGLYENTTRIDGYNSSNTSGTSLTYAPYILDKTRYNYEGVLFSSLKLKVITKGKLSIGYVNGAVADGGAYDSTKVVVTNEIILNKVGEQVVYLEHPFCVPTNAHLLICLPTDTAVFAYGSNGTEKGFFSTIPSTQLYKDNANMSLGVSLYELRQIESKSTYQGKKLSILGDSISTYQGYIPEGNVTYYPRSTVNDVNKTWWMKLINALGMELEVNNSWSGSRVTTTNGSTSAGCGDRAEALGTNPDVIIIWMGINDFDTETPLGTYDGKSALPETTTSFREAYAIMLNKVLTKYKTAEVFVCTLPQCEQNAYSSGFPEINDSGVALLEFNEAIMELANAFGVKVLELHKCGLKYHNMSIYNFDDLHPNADGHSLIANYGIWQMDNYVRTRY